MLLANQSIEFIIQNVTCAIKTYIGKTVVDNVGFKSRMNQYIKVEMEFKHVNFAYMCTSVVGKINV